MAVCFDQLVEFLQKMLCIAHQDICFNTWVLVVAGHYECIPRWHSLPLFQREKNSVIITAAGIGGFVGRTP
jgi:hypothetical protein